MPRNIFVQFYKDGWKNCYSYMYFSKYKSYVILIKFALLWLPNNILL